MLLSTSCCTGIVLVLFVLGAILVQYNYAGCIVGHDDSETAAKPDGAAPCWRSLPSHRRGSKQSCVHGRNAQVLTMNRSSISGYLSCAVGRSGMRPPSGRILLAAQKKDLPQQTGHVGILDAKYGTSSAFSCLLGVLLSFNTKPETCVSPGPLRYYTTYFVLWTCKGLGGSTQPSTKLQIRYEI